MTLPCRFALRLLYVGPLLAATTDEVFAKPTAFGLSKTLALVHYFLSIPDVNGVALRNSDLAALQIVEGLRFEV